MYYNQNNYPELPYPHPSRPDATVKSSGCGPCCASMIVEGLSGQAFPPEVSAPFAISAGARASSGTDMSVLAPRLSGAFGLPYAMANTADALTKALDEGAWAIANVGGDRAGYTGLFSQGGHYIVVKGVNGQMLTVWDPNYYPGKFDKPGRKGRVTIKGNDIFVSLADLQQDTEQRWPRYYIFQEAEMTKSEVIKIIEEYAAQQAAMPVSSWAESQWKDLTGRGIVDGTAPRSPATREQLAVILSRLGL